MANKKQRAREFIIKTIYMTAFIFILGMVVVSCTKEEEEPLVVSKVSLVYLAADNSLSGEGYDKLEAIRQGWTATPGSRVLVYFDSADKGASLLELRGDHQMDILEEYGEENAAASEVFRRVILKAAGLYPQATLNLLVFSHASGWLPQCSYNNPSLRSVVMDRNNEMDLADFADAIPNNSFQYIIFEACHMAGIEVAYQLRYKARYLVASSAEIVSPGFTDIYREYIGELVSGNPVSFMQQAFNYFDKQTGYMRSATFSVIKTAKLEDLAGFIKTYCDINKEVNITNIQPFDRNSDHLFFDFGSYYLSLLATDTQREELSALIEACVVWKATTPYFMEGYRGFVIEEHSGLTAYIMQEAYPSLNERYKQTEWYKAIK
ncbi:conserved hypothetical protein [uncultured Dysgonomonas sp.]|uniref:Clostripain n=1 Tax=uncultured Dysgonomonas sp. TaxID=206096 RepID=A0A212K5B8_9BACT|nr:clostripain-related cysteine peptidase [uncultured Dysgonomonas sp.]SBW06695.1 conserved hypothetical protein [uncultured Dysgonomonas sp.]